MFAYFGGLWRQPNFMKLWVGQTISLAGSHIGGGAIRYTAILTLAATPIEASALAAAGLLPVLLFGLLAGVLVDRLPCRRLLIGADIGRALLLLSIPVAYALGTLHMAQLYLVAALVGTLTIVFNVAYEAFLPRVVLPEQLVEGNSKLGVSAAVAEIGGPPLAGVLVQLLTAPIAIVVDTLSFFCSAAALWRIKVSEGRPRPTDQRAQVRREIAEGLGVVWQSRVLRALLGVQVTFNLGGGIIGSLYDLYLIDVLALSPALVGITVGVGGVSALAGALLAERMTHRFGIGRTLVWSLLILSAASALIPLAHGSPLTAMGYILLAQLTDAAFTVYTINEVSLRQVAAPEAMRGRVSASFQLLGTAASLVGIVLGGLLGQTIGLRGAIAVGVCISALMVVWVVRSPVGRLQSVPQAA